MKIRSILAFFLKSIFLAMSILSILAIILFISRFILSICDNDNLGEDYILNYSSYYIAKKTTSNNIKIVIPARIVDYKYNSLYVTVKQKPDRDIVYNEFKDKYRLGIDTTYYWLIVKKRDEIVGPVDSIEAHILYKKYNIPKNIQLD